jgi:beta-glucosidase
VIYDPSSPLKAIQALALNSVLRFDDGTDPTSAAGAAKASSVAIVFLTNWESEGMDLPDLNFPNGQDALVSAVAAANPNTIVVMENGGPQVMPWLSSVSAVVEAWFPGQRGGEAIANILFGKVNPSGKLPMTFPASVNDLPRPTIPGDPNASAPFDVVMNEGFNVGYKWYDSQGITPLFPFGFGLSYTTFSISGLKAGTVLAPPYEFSISGELTNTGSIAGSQVVQVYLGFPSSAGEPPKRLIGWEKISVNPGASAAFNIDFNSNDPSHPLSYWDTTSNSWQIALGGIYQIYIGTSSAMSDLRAFGTIQIGP